MFFAIASGWLARSHWVAYVDFIGFICYSHWVLCADPLTLCVLASGWLAQFHLVLLVLLVLPVGGLGVASGWYTQFLLLFLFFPLLDRSVWAVLGLKRAAPKVCVFSCWDKLRFRGE